MEWPEEGVPKTGEVLIEFIAQVHKTKEQFGQEGPICVHCRYVRDLLIFLLFPVILSKFSSFMADIFSLLSNICDEILRLY